MDYLLGSEKSLINRGELFDSIFSAASIGIGIVKDRIIIEVNPYLCDLLGYSPGELIGKSSSLLYPNEKEFNRVGKEKYDEIKKTGKGTVETRLVKKNGEILEIRVSSIPLDPSGKQEPPDPAAARLISE